MNIFEKLRNIRLWGVKFEKVTQEWLLFKKHSIKESIYSNYNYIINSYLNNKFERKRLNYFLKYDINEYVDDLETELSNKTIRDIILVLKAILKFAERKYNVNFKLDLISMPSLQKKELQVFSEREIKKIVKECINLGEIRYIGILISIYTGMRIGEVCALKWENIDLNKKLINVTQTLQRVTSADKKTKVIISSPKTKASERKIPIPSILYEELKKRSSEYTKETYVITGEENKFLEPRSYQYIYKKVLENAKLKYRSFHCLRHTFATRCVRVGMDVKALSELLGHSNVNITLNRYVHSSYDCQKKYMDKL